MEIGGHVAASLVAQAIAREDINSAEVIASPIAAVLTLIFFRSVVAALLPIAIGGFALATCAAEHPTSSRRLERGERVHAGHAAGREQHQDQRAQRESVDDERDRRPRAQEAQ